MLRRTCVVGAGSFFGVLAKGSRDDFRFLRYFTAIALLSTSVIKDRCRGDIVGSTYVFCNLSGLTSVDVRLLRFLVVYKDIVSFDISNVIKAVVTSDGGDQVFLLCMDEYRVTWLFKDLIMVNRVVVVT